MCLKRKRKLAMQDTHVCISAISIGEIFVSRNSATITSNWSSINNNELLIFISLEKIDEIR